MDRSSLRAFCANNLLLALALLAVFAVWLLLMARTLSLDVRSFARVVSSGLSAKGEQLSLEELRALPSYSLSARKYADRLPGYAHSQDSGSSVLPDYYLRDEHLGRQYPRYFPLRDLLESWPARDVSAAQWARSPAHPLLGEKNERAFYRERGRENPFRVVSEEHSVPQGLYRLNFQNASELQLAFALRDRELPYILYNVPALSEAIEREFAPLNLLRSFGSLPRVVERSRDNEFLYYTAKQLAGLTEGDWTPPQQDVLLSFPAFLEEAFEAENNNNVAHSSGNKESKSTGPGPRDIVGPRALHYLIVSASEGARTAWIKRALPFFQPVESLFMREPEQYRGINCRFGMKGIIAAAHYDSRTNYIAMLRGRKRYVLLPPSECPNLELYPRGHPSARHSSVLWSNLTEVNRFPALAQSRATEVVLSMGEMLYLPSYWFHYIVSQDASIQCNSRSGESQESKATIDQCGFGRRSDKEKTKEESLDIAEQSSAQSERKEEGEHEQSALEDRDAERRHHLRRHRMGQNKKKKRSQIDWMAMQ